METKKKALIFLLFAGIMFFTAQSAFGGCEVAALDALIEVSGNAPGTKLSGPITVFYKDKSGIPTIDSTADMYFFLRLRKGSDLHQFAGMEPNVTFHEFEEHATYIEDFFEDIVVPALYDCDPGYPSDCSNPPYVNCSLCPEIVLKSYDMDVDWEAPGYNDGFFFFIADIVVAVQD